MALPILDGNQSATTLSTILTGGQHIPAHTVVSLGSQAITDMRGAVSGSVVSISNFPATQTVAGTVTANVANPSDIIGGGYPNLFAFLDDTAPNVTINGAPSVDGTLPISGTVTANVTNSVTVGSIVGPIGGSVFKGNSASTDAIRVLPFFSQNGFANYNEISTSNALPVSGTVTVGAMPSGALTTRFGSVTTANTAQLTSAVTNTSRKYLLVQNIATSTVTIGIGFAPTTTQGIQLTAGGGLTFDAFCPTGGVWWLSSTTGSNFSILEG